MADKVSLATLALAKAYTDEHGGGGGGTSNYNDLTHKPTVNGVEFKGTMTGETLGLVDAEDGKGLSANDYTDADKSIVGGVTSALAGKVDKVSGKGLSTNDYTDADKTALSANTTAISNIKDGTTIDSFGDVETALAGKQDTLTFDNVPTDNSNNPVKSNGIYDAVNDVYVANGIVGAKNFGVYHDYGVSGSDANGFTLNNNGSCIIAEIKPNIAYTISKKWTVGDRFRLVALNNLSFTTADTTGHQIVNNNSQSEPYTWTNADSYKYLVFVFEASTHIGDTAEAMIRLATDTDTTYVPYAMTNKELTDSKFPRSEQALLGAKNILPNPNPVGSSTHAELTVTTNADGTITIGAGTTGSSNDGSYHFTEGMVFSKGNYILSGIPSNIDKTGMIIEIKTGSFSGTKIADIGYNKPQDIINLENDTALYIRMYIYKDITWSSDLVWKPMIRLASDTDATYQPYAMTNHELTNKVEDSYFVSDSAETTFADNDKIPFYDTSATATKNSTWSNIKSKLKTYFDTLYATPSSLNSKMSYEDNGIVGAQNLLGANMGMAWNTNGNLEVASHAVSSEKIKVVEGQKFSFSKSSDSVQNVFTNSNDNLMIRKYDSTGAYVSSSTGLAYNATSNTFTVPSGTGYIALTQYCAGQDMTKALQDSCEVIACLGNSTTYREYAMTNRELTEEVHTKLGMYNFTFTEPSGTIIAGNITASNEEVVVGTYKGQTLYMRAMETLFGDMNFNPEDAGVAEVNSHDIANIDKIIYTDCYCKASSSGSIWYPLPYRYNHSDWFYVNVGKTYVTGYTTGSTSISTFYFMAVIYYTKTS